MTGREEMENKLKENNLRRLADAPKVIVDFYKNMVNKTESTKKYYIVILLQYISFLRSDGIDVDDYSAFSLIRPNGINSFIDYYRNGAIKGAKGKKSDGSVVTAFNVINSFYSYLVKNDYITKNPCDNAYKPKNGKHTKPVVLTKNETDIIRENIFSNCGKEIKHSKYGDEWMIRNYTIFTFGCRTALRCSAISGINISDINFDECYVVVTEKGNNKREAYFGENTKEMLLKWIEVRSKLMEGYPPTDALFISDRRKRICNEQIGEILSKYTFNINKHITPHKMRSTAITNVYEKTGDIYLAADLAGHKNVATTKIYARISEKAKKRAANILDEI